MLVFRMPSGQSEGRQRAVTLIEGPQWSAEGLDIRSGRYPLSVERHVMRMADLLVPGVTTVTPHARYYALHALIADEAAARQLSIPAAQDLLRRAEVALAAVSYGHDHQNPWLPRAHGTDALAASLHDGEIDMDEASQPRKGGYVRNVWGFWNPYAASEVTLRILSRGDMPLPGDACDAASVRSALGGLLELARQRQLNPASLDGSEELCVCSGGRAADGRWLAQLLCARASDASRAGSSARQETIRLMARVMQTHEIEDPAGDVLPIFAFGNYITSDTVTDDLAVTPVWRGVALRNYAVGAWRRLWSWMVEQVDGLMPVVGFTDRFCEAFPAQTVGAFLAQLPATVTANGAPAPAEEHLRSSDLPLPVRELAVLAASSRRVDELSGRVGDAFLGQRGVELGPEWVARRIDEARAMPLRDFTRRLAVDLLVRARRVALSKARREADGKLWLPARLHERGDLLYRTSLEGRGDVGLRLDQLATVLAGAGVLHFPEGCWRPTPAGEALLD
jgi:hypothetical protein